MNDLSLPPTLKNLFADEEEISGASPDITHLRSYLASRENSGKSSSLQNLIKALDSNPDSE